MQEPVLFNTDIKTNILFGKPDATDEEVYIAAQKANALQFIESNVEDLTPEQKLQNLSTDLKKAFEALKTKFPNVANLFTDYENQPPNIKQLVLELLNSVNESLLAKANDSIENFKQAIDKCAAKFGSGWADIIINFNWHSELAGICEQSKLASDVKAMVAKYPDLFAGFNLDTIRSAEAKGISGVDELAMFVREQLSNFRMTVVSD